MQFKVALVSLFAAMAIAAPELDKRCTADGGSCTQLSQCCSGNCEYDSSVGLVCRPAKKMMEKRCTANGDSNGTPLFSDLEQEVYMDIGYSHADVELLKDIGTATVEWDDLIDRVAADLDRPDSKMKSPETENEWHTRAAALLLTPFYGSEKDPKGVLLRPDELYLPDALNEYSAENLFKPPDRATRGYPAKFLPIKYLQAVPQHTRHHGRSWAKWLEKVVGITPIPRLACETGPTQDFHYIMEHRSARMIGLFQKHSSQYESLIPFVSDELRKCKVPTEAGSERILEDLYIPLPRLKAPVREIRGIGHNFALLPEDIKDEDEGKWMFLKQFGVTFTDDLQFYVKTLRVLRYSHECNGLSTKSVEGCVFKIYGGITRNCRADEDIDTIRYSELPLISEPR
ncbi:hypothetical protein SLS58_001722 [Diplodia intermedia]|uniref:Uncharacterized protein n=1 Tax=Diplodia intermedia TaxID=856260 RepID=A0ABR3U0R2_9PEZI